MESKQSLEIRHHNAITTARYEYTELQMDLFFYLLSQLRKENEKGVYQISVRDLAEVTGKKQNHVQLRKATADMGSRVFEVQTRKSYKQIWMFQSVEYLDGEGIIALKLSEDIRPYLFELKENFTSFQLYAALRLSSKYAKRIYSICSQWKDKAETPQMEIAELKRMLGVIDEKGNDKFKKISQLREWVLDVSVNQISTHTDLRISYELSKRGRSYELIKFVIKRQAQAPQLSIAFEDPLDDNKAAACKRNLELLKIVRPDLVQQILASPDLVAKVNRFVYDLRTEKVKANTNAGGLLLKTLGLV
ncbi:replication initiation protein [Hymenobacter endophyticus]|uniref:Replication initiation protein n=1 Tax=Hymenobacter endophyticus TaxID=3076335 RepID=A0ABU3TKV4_9BACT|nr:replication initiation protein [Hymenobacter endophyticus]MDU0372007.1 replication initiation protein [Hymenobacter endophyticus]